MALHALANALLEYETLSAEDKADSSPISRRNPAGGTARTTTRGRGLILLA